MHSVLADGARERPQHVVLSRRTAEGRRDVDFRTLAEHVDAVAGLFLRAGIQAGDRVAVLGRTCYEWVVTDFAAAGIGAIVVPVYPTSSEHQIRHVLTDSGAAWCVAESTEDADRLRAAGARKIWLFPEIDAAQASDADLAAHRSKVRADDVATIVYTSGTTGLPKGCMLTHRNLYASSANTVRQTGKLFTEHDGEQASTLLCLPLSHVFGRTILLSCLIAGTRTGLLAGVPDLLRQLPVFEPTFLALVPYALEKLRKRARELPDDVRKSFGGKLSHVISGGASLDESTAEFYAGLGIDILNCYGLTEAATAVTVNAPGTNRRGSVGRPIPGTTVAIAADGEVLVRGRNVSPGYWPGGTEPDDGEEPWLHTGDLGRLDEDGFLYITGRRKEILVTSGGKNVAPAPLEDRIRLHPLVSNCMVVGDGRPFVAALITLDEAAVARWQPGREPAELLTDPALPAEIQTAVDEANTLVSRAESIRAFRVVTGDFDVARGLLTPSMKLRRAQIEQAYAEDLSILYGSFR